MDSSPPFPEIHEVVRAARSRLRERLTAGAQANPAGPETLDPARLREAVERVRLSEKLVGQPPPQPAGLRARIGAMVVRLTRRMLFWYTPPILQFHGAVAQAMEEQMASLEELSRAVEQLKRELRSREGRLPD